MSLLNPDWVFIPHDTLILFDEMQECPDCTTSLKFFKLDGRYDVICSGSLLGVHYKKISSVSVGYKEDVEMHSLDFEEFLWAKGYRQEQINKLLWSLERSEENPSGLRGRITKYAEGLDKGKIKNIYNHIPVFLAKENKKFQITKIASGARNREYVGTVDWLNDAGIINQCFCLNQPELPLKGNYKPNDYKIYFRDTGLLIASLDDEAQQDLRANKNFNTYKGAVYENIIADILVKEGYNLYYYKSDKPSLEMDFFVRTVDSLVPVEVKATDNATISLNSFIKKDTYADVKFGIKLANKNIGFNGVFYTFPYFCAFMLKRWLAEVNM